jgi:hypothetical protein
MELLSEGLYTEEVAARMFISPTTVRVCLVGARETDPVRSGRNEMTFGEAGCNRVRGSGC